MIQILRTLVGSRAHNLHTDDSDFDFRGVYVNPTSEILKLGGATQQTNWIEGQTDDTSFEIQKFLMMAVKSNPSTLEIFMGPDYPVNIQHATWGLKLRELFPHVWNSTDVYNSFKGYGKNQQKKFLEEKDTRPHKYAVAYLRTLYNAVQLLSTGTFSLDTSNTPIYETLKRWKNKEYTVGEVMQTTHEWEQELKDIYESCEKKETNLEPINEFLLEVRKEFWI